MPRLYLNLIPECLVASTLTPENYGSYMAVGVQGKTRGQAMFFEVDPALAGKDFAAGVEQAFARCESESTPEDPKRSVYVAVYRVVERVPLVALRKLYLATDDGRVLGLEQAPHIEEVGRVLHLYQELAPLKPRVVSRLAPCAFCQHLTDPGVGIHVPRLVFAEMVLHELAENPEHPAPKNLPYRALPHLRICLLRLVKEPHKMTKVVRRHLDRELLYRTIRNGFFVGDREGFLFYPMPPQDVLETTHRDWWRSAQTVIMD